MSPATKAATIWTIRAARSFVFEHLVDVIQNNTLTFEQHFE